MLPFLWIMLTQFAINVQSHFYFYTHCTTSNHRLLFSHFCCCSRLYHALYSYGVALHCRCARDCYSTQSTVWKETRRLLSHTRVETSVEGEGYKHAMLSRLRALSQDERATSIHRIFLSLPPSLLEHSSRVTCVFSLHSQQPDHLPSPWNRVPSA